MGYPEDNVKPYRLYDPEGTEGKLQRKMNTSVVNAVKPVAKVAQAAANVAETSLGGAGAKKIGRGLARPFKDFSSQRQSVDKIRNPEKYREPVDIDAQASVMSPQPATAEFDDGSPGSAPGRRFSTGGMSLSGLDGQNKANIEDARFYPGSNNATTATVAKQGSPVPAGVKQEVGNLDVTFDKSVDQGSRQRFMEDPLRPTAQINRFKNRRPGRVFSTKLNPDKEGPPKQPEILTSKNSKEGWKTRRAINKENSDRYAAELDAYYGNVDAKRQDARKGEANQTYKDSVSGINKGRDADIAAKKAKMEQEAKAQEIKDALISEADPVKRKELERQLGVLSGATKGEAAPDMHYFDEEGYDDEGRPIKRQFAYNPATDVTRSLQPGGGGGGQGGAIDIPDSEDQLVKGQLYKSQNGSRYWDGQHFVLDM